MASCARCGIRITGDEAGLSRKLINRSTEKLYCIQCLSHDFKVSPEQLREMIIRFREAGCVLFR